MIKSFELRERFGRRFIGYSLFAFFTAISISGATVVQIMIAPVAGGFLADDNGDGIFDRALPNDGFGVGGANEFHNTGSRSYQGSYEWDLSDPFISPVEQSQIVSVILTFNRNTYGSNPPAPHLRGIAAGYTGDGLFDFRDANAGAAVAGYTVWNHSSITLPQPDLALDVTGFFLATFAAGDRFLGFNLRADDPLPAGSTVDNFFWSPRLVITTAPEPSAALLVLGVATTAMLRRGRRSVTTF